MYPYVCQTQQRRPCSSQGTRGPLAVLSSEPVGFKGRLNQALTDLDVVTPAFEFVDIMSNGS